jgi:O-antigen ligase
MYWFLCYLGVYLLNFPFVAGESVVGEYPYWEHFFTLLQLVTLFWLASSLMAKENMARSALLAFLIAASLVALGNVFQVPGFYAVEEQGRITALSDNPGALAERMAFAAVITLGLYLSNSDNSWRNRLLLLLALAFLVVMVRSGSRGQTAAFIFGACVYLLPYGRSKRVLAGIILALCSIFTVVSLIISNPYVSDRWQQSYQGDLAQRQIIYPLAIDMILERPILGWHPTIWDLELGRGIAVQYYWSGKDAHNLVLSILLEVGLLGATPFFIGLALCLRSAWRARKGDLGILPLALMVTALGFAMSVTSFILSGSKAQWLILGLTIASASTPATKRGQKAHTRCGRLAMQSRTGYVRHLADN